MTKDEKLKIKAFRDYLRQMVSLNKTEKPQSAKLLLGQIKKSYEMFFIDELRPS